MIVAQDNVPERHANHGRCVVGHEHVTPFPISTWLMVLIAIAILLPLALSQVLRWVS